MPTLARILIYPIKSLDPVSLDHARVLSTGALENDRRWAIVDASGKSINGKRTAVVHRLRATFDDPIEQVQFRFDGQEARFNLSNDLDPLEAWLTNVLQQPVHLLENSYGGYPDDTEAPGPTAISTATLETVAGWFPPMSVEESRLRFRANLEITDVPPFWEDLLFGPAGSEVAFQVGTVRFVGTNPCQRCVVPTRHPATGEIWPQFTLTFTKQREATMPTWAERSRFNHFYRLATNTHLAVAGGVIHVGDTVTIES